MVCRDEVPANPEIQFSPESDRDPSAPFDFGIFGDGLLYVFLDGPSSIDTVDWYIDDEYARTEYICPYDLASTNADDEFRDALPLDTTGFAFGLHQIRAEVFFVDGTSATITRWWFKI